MVEYWAAPSAVSSVAHSVATTVEHLVEWKGQMLVENLVAMMAGNSVD